MRDMGCYAKASRHLLVGLAELDGPPIDRVLGHLTGLELLRVRCTFGLIKLMCERESLWKSLCQSAEFGLGSSALSDMEMAALSPFVVNYRMLYMQALPLRRRCFQSTCAVKPFNSTRSPSFAAQAGAPDMCFCEVYDATNPQACRWYGDRRIFGSLARKVVLLDAAWKSSIARYGSELPVPLDIVLPYHDNGFEQPLEVRCIFMINGELVPVADTFAFSGEGDARWLYSRDTGSETITVHLDIRAINDNQGSRLVQATIDLAVLVELSRNAGSLPPLGPHLRRVDVLDVLRRHRPAMNGHVQCFPCAPADGVWCPDRPQLKRFRANPPRAIDGERATIDTEPLHLSADALIEVVPDPGN